MLEILLIALFIILLAVLGTPLYVVISALAILLFWQADISLQAILLEWPTVADSPTLMAIPLFTFAGYLLANSNTPQRLINFSRTLLGWLPGGEAIIALVACAIFTAFTGASGVTIIALGGLLYPLLAKQGFSENFNLGLLTSSGSLGLLFPPSLPIILYSMVAAVSLDQLFVAGIIPGILLIALLSAYALYRGQHLKMQRRPFVWREFIDSAVAARYEIPLPIIILFGFYGGLFTLTDAALVTVAYVLVVEIVIYKDIKVKQLPEIIRESMILVGGILLILGSALGLTNYLVDAEVPKQIFAAMKTVIDDRITFLIFLNLFLLIVGLMMDIFSAIIVVVPLILPIAREFGIDPVHLGIIFLTNMEIGYSTPPVGLNLFISSFRFEKPVVQLYRASLPFIAIMLVALILITYIPELSLSLVEWLGIR
jgi:C4-dicarboxylate transporter DctM subunit